MADWSKPSVDAMKRDGVFGGGGVMKKSWAFDGDDEPTGIGAIDFELRPEILTHPNIPKPLHGLNPRVLKGQKWWDEKRQAAYASTGYRCAACGVHKTKARGPKWLEAHEFHDIDYKRGRVEVKEIVPLCHYCHNFIHSGRLYMVYLEGNVNESDCINILEHGFKILSENKLKCFPTTIHVADRLQRVNRHGVEPYNIIGDPSIGWSDWRFVLEGVSYSSKFESMEDWQEHYQGKGK